jgi:hypothetical protein
MDKEHVTTNLLSSVSGILIFISLAYWMDLNGLTAFAPIILASGLFIFFFPDPFLKILSPLGIITKPLLLTVSHILIFIGSKVYFDRYIDHFWIVYLIIGIILLNKHADITKALFGNA